jgi:hypothetical protein
MNRKQPVLKLNANFFPIGIADWKDVIISIMSGSSFPVDVYYSENEDGSFNKEVIETFNVVRDWKEWEKLPIRNCDEYIQGATRVYRVPPIVVCSKFNKIICKNVQFPTKRNIWKRDGFICQYSNKVLDKDQLSVDHIIPVSRGGENSWSNLVTCDKSLNIWKDNRTPEECKLKLIREPKKPVGGMVFDFMRKEWEIFLGK